MFVLVCGWDLVNQRLVEVSDDVDGSIRCSCRVANKLWLGVKGTCHILNLQTHKIEVSIRKYIADEV